jgi:hypothetical protein
MHRSAWMGLCALGLLAACDNTPAPVPLVLTRSTVGGPCTVNGDCVAGLSCETSDPGGQCTKACSAASDCPSGGVCNDEGACYKGCSSDADCRTGEGYACVDGTTISGAATKICDVPPAAPTGAAVGAACIANSDCMSGLSCETSDPGGQCTKSCSAASDCPSGAVCNDEGACYKGCSSDADCRTAEGYACVDAKTIGGAATKVCDVAPAGAAVGAACTANSNCMSGLSCETSDPGGQCTKSCSAATDCPIGAVCNDEGACYKGCSSDSDCRTAEGYACVDAKTIAGAATKVCDVAPTGAAVGAACTANSDCMSGLSCETSDPGGQCTKSCSTASDCPQGAVCNNEGACYKGCSSKADCRTAEGYACVDGKTISGAATKICDVP